MLNTFGQVQTSIHQKHIYAQVIRVHTEYLWNAVIK